MTEDARFQTEIPIRYRDLDPENHVNNAVYGTYIEAARTNYIDAVIGDSVIESGLVIAHLEIDYRRPITLDDESVAITVETTDIGDSSVTMSFELATAAGIAATGASVLVTVDDNGKPRSIPEEWHDRIRQFEPALDQ
ncbi:acyl-CoA thioesterase [Halocatena halophila]|uniref:acyl-CoA thioesterase n=1 Tax=Halocatena halophila TaxID=2814576 RepID=UPI002ED0246A